MAAQNGPTLQQRIFLALRDRIVYGFYRPGQSLPEKEICREFNASRTPFREAVLKLQDLKLVSVIPRYGTSVAPVDIDDIRAAFELKVELEGLAGQLAAERISADLLGELRRAIDAGARLARSRKTERRLRLLAIEAEFHDTIRRAAGNHVLKEYLENLHLRCARLWSLNPADEIREADILEQMRGICGAVERRDAVAARELMRAHVQFFIDKIKAQLL